jgi:hypothetical protein
MQTVVLFVSTGRKDQPTGGWKNKIYTRSLRKIGFIDNRYPKDGAFPKDDEHWLVEIVRENMNDKGGCFILRPVQMVPRDDLMPLVHGSYEMRQDEDAVIITPNDKAKFWVMSPSAKRSILEAYGAETPSGNARALVIDHGGSMWTRRAPPEAVMENEAKKLLQDLED